MAISRENGQEEARDPLHPPSTARTAPRTVRVRAGPNGVSHVDHSGKRNEPPLARRDVVGGNQAFQRVGGTQAAISDEAVKVELEFDVLAANDAEGARDPPPPADLVHGSGGRVVRPADLGELLRARDVPTGVVIVDQCRFEPHELDSGGRGDAVVEGLPRGLSLATV